MPQPYYVVFAGVNGSGKSTFFHSGLWRTADMPKRMIRVNPDELLRGMEGHWRSEADQLRAGKAAIGLMNEAFSSRASLNCETTLAGRSAVARIGRARNLGYRVVLYYIGVCDAATALSRIEHRVRLGGHGIDPAVVERRFGASLAGLCAAIPLCDEVHVFDNTIDFRNVAGWKDGVLCWWGCGGAAGGWLVDAMADGRVWRR